MEERLLLQTGSNTLYTGDGSVDMHGKPVLKTNTGNWRACIFILGTECCERMAYFGIGANLVIYLSDVLHLGNVSAATTVNAWGGTCYLTPLIGAVLADSYFGRYWTIATFSLLHFIGMCGLTLSASVPALQPTACSGSLCPPATTAQLKVFLFGLYLIALGNGGIKPCVLPFGADQFDDTDHEERIRKGSFFNWFYLSINVGAFISCTVIVYVQINKGWAIGFGIPAACMCFAIVCFFSGTSMYRFQRPVGSPFTRICQVLVASFYKRNVEVPNESSLLYETRDEYSATEGSRKLEHTDKFKCLDKAAVVTDAEMITGGLTSSWRLCTVTQVEELKILVRMFPIWATGIIYFAVYAQVTMFIEQGTMMDTTIGSFTIPVASLATFDIISVICWVPIYDRIIAPIARKFTGKERGFSEIQRIGIGLFISILAMSAAALIETKRLQLAKELDLTDKYVAVPLSIMWQIPQYMLCGAAEVFTCIGQLEFFYEQSPDTMRSLCSALLLVSTSLGSYLSAFILSLVRYLTARGENGGWIPDNLNAGRLDYYFWLLAGFSFINMVVYIICAIKYKQKVVF